MIPFLYYIPLRACHSSNSYLHFDSLLVSCVFWSFVLAWLHPASLQKVIFLMPPSYPFSILFSQGCQVTLKTLATPPIHRDLVLPSSSVGELLAELEEGTKLWGRRGRLEPEERHVRNKYGRHLGKMLRSWIERVKTLRVDIMFDGFHMTIHQVFWSLQSCINAAYRQFFGPRGLVYIEQNSSSRFRSVARFCCLLGCTYLAVHHVQPCDTMGIYLQPFMFKGKERCRSVAW